MEFRHLYFLFSIMYWRICRANILLNVFVFSSNRTCENLPLPPRKFLNARKLGIQIGIVSGSLCEAARWFLIDINIRMRFAVLEIIVIPGARVRNSTPSGRRGHAVNISSL